MRGEAGAGATFGGGTVARSSGVGNGDFRTLHSLQATLARSNHRNHAAGTCREAGIPEHSHRTPVVMRTSRLDAAKNFFKECTHVLFFSKVAYVPVLAFPNRGTGA